MGPLDPQRPRRWAPARSAPGGPLPDLDQVADDQIDPDAQIVVEADDFLRALVARYALVSAVVSRP
jgi:hypothetical protein